MLCQNSDNDKIMISLSILKINNKIKNINLWLDGSNQREENRRRGNRKGGRIGGVVKEEGRSEKGREKDLGCRKKA